MILNCFFPSSLLSIFLAVPLVSRYFSPYPQSPSRSHSRRFFRLESMNSREVSLVTSATLFGALASAVALGFLSNFNPLKKTKTKQQQQQHNNQHERSSSPLNGAVPGKPSPFDPSKRQGYRFLLVPSLPLAQLLQVITVFFSIFVFLSIAV